MTTILWLIIVGILIELSWKRRVKKTEANTSGILANDKIVRSVKDLWREERE
jgi:hypothetical protein